MSTVSSHSNNDDELPEVLKVLAHPLRWVLIRALTRSDLRVQELMARVNEPANLVSYHLRQLRDAHLVTEHRSAADGRDIYYSLDLERLQADFFAAGALLHPALKIDVDANQDSGIPPTLLAASVDRARRMERGASLTALPHASSETPIRILFLCTHNSARSQMAEALLRARSDGAIDAYSAGNEPRTVHPLAIRVLTEMGIDASGQRAKHYDDYRGQQFDYVITLCDHIREACPVFPGTPELLHWSFPDPVAVPVANDAQYQAFVQTALQLITRIRFLLPIIADERGRAA